MEISRSTRLAVALVSGQSVPQRLAADIAQQWAFERYLFKKLFHELEAKFRNVTFDYQEKEKRLVFMQPIVEVHLLSLREVLSLAEKVFGKGVPMSGLYKAQHKGQTGLGFNPNQPDAYPAHIQINDISTGYWEAEAFLEGIEGHLPDLEKAVADFSGKVTRLGDLADQKVAKKYPD